MAGIVFVERNKCCYKYIMVKLLELFSGTHSVGKVCKEKGWNVLSVDIDGRADINIDITKWDYKKDYMEGEFDIIWASPPCHTFSALRRVHIGRKLRAFGDEIVTSEMLDKDMIDNGLPLLRKAEEIIEYFKPKFFFIENPATGRMKEFLTHYNYYDVDYCKYSDWGYRKRTRIWSNNITFVPKICCKDCDNIVNGKHRVDMAAKHSGGNNKKTLDLKYRIPPQLIRELFESCELY